jgi:hypothetical protein
MNKPFKISKLKDFLGITIGVFAAIIILFTQSFYFDYVAQAQSNVKSNQTEKTDKEPTILKVGQVAMAHAVEVTIQNALHFISDIYFDESNSIHIDNKPQVSFNTLFVKLFRLIISPNAP